MRLNEVALHSWDVRVAFDPAAAVPAVAAEVLLELLGGELGFMLGFTGKAEALGRLAAVSLPSTDSCLVIADGVSVAAAEPTAAFSGPAESVVRLLAGRLDPDHTPSSVEVTGDVTLEELRGVFPGY
jgi:hypothetical protein